MLCDLGGRWAIGYVFGRSVIVNGVAVGGVVGLGCGWRMMMMDDDDDG